MSFNSNVTPSKKRVKILTPSEHDGLLKSNSMGMQLIQVDSHQKKLFKDDLDNENHLQDGQAKISQAKNIKISEVLN